MRLTAHPVAQAAATSRSTVTRHRQSRRAPGEALQRETTTTVASTTSDGPGGDHRAAPARRASSFVHRHNLAARQGICDSSWLRPARATLEPGPDAGTNRDTVRASSDTTVAGRHTSWLPPLGGDRRAGVVDRTWPLRDSLTRHGVVARAGSGAGSRPPCGISSSREVSVARPRTRPSPVQAGTPCGAARSGKARFSQADTLLPSPAGRLAGQRRAPVRRSRA